MTKHNIPKVRCSCEYGANPSNMCARCAVCHTRLCQIHAGKTALHTDGIGEERYHPDPLIHNYGHDCERLVNKKKPLEEYRKEWLLPKKI